MSRCIVASAFVLLLAAVAGCDDTRHIDVVCDKAQLGSEIAGVWKLEATGERKGCDNRRYEGDLELKNTVGIVVTAREIEATPPASPADAFVERIVRRSEFTLDTRSAPSELTFTGSTEGSCVDAELTELLPNGDELAYELHGMIVHAGFIEGTFTGHGPEACETSGSFSVDVAPN